MTVSAVRLEPVKFEEPKSEERSAKQRQAKKSYTVNVEPLKRFLEASQNLQMLKALAPSFSKDATCCSLALKVISEKPFEAELQRQIQELPAVEKDKYHLQATHKKIQGLSKKTRLCEALDLASPNKNFIEETLFKNNTLETVLRDAEQLALSLAPRLRVVKDPVTGAITESTVTDPQSLPIDAILMMGNNDLDYVDYAVMIYRQLPNKEQITFYVMGFGGYGTTVKPIFYYTEATTIAERLRDLGVPKKQIVTERNSTSTMQNVRFLEEIFKEKKVNHRHFLVMGTPMAQLRQSRLLEMKAHFDWQSISTFPTRDFTSYFSTKTQATGNLLFALREVMFTMEWLIKKGISTRPIENRELFCQNFKLVCSYYKRLSQKDVNFDQDIFLEEFFTSLKSEDNALNDTLLTRLKAIRSFIIESFDLQASICMPRLTSQYSFVKHADYLNQLQSPTFAALNIEKNCSFSPWIEK
jgi:hypothetical protein